MITLEKLQKNKKSTTSSYKPSKKVSKTSAKVFDFAAIAENQRNKPLREFNGETFYSFLNICSDRYNENTEPVSSDPTESWKSNTVRPFTRNKVRSIAAQATASILYPLMEAVSKDGSTDKALAKVMGDIVEYVLEQDDYSEKIIDIVVDMLTKPAVFVKQGFYKHMKTVKQIQSDGSYTEKQVLNHIYSGFKLHIIPAENIYLGNIHEGNIQKQPFIIEHKLVDFEDAKARHGHLAQFKHVQPGKRVFLDTESKLFFSQEILDLSNTLVEELTFYSLPLDLELVFVGGILVHNDPDRPIQQLREDKVYPFVMKGYEKIHNNFAYYRPLVWNLKNIQDDLDIMHRMVQDGTFLRMMPPTAIYGDEGADNTVLIPGNLIEMSSPESYIKPIDVGFDIGAGLNAVNKLEQAGAETSTSEISSGIPLTKEATKFELSLLEQNATTKLSLFGKQLLFLVRDIGRLTVASVLEHMPLADIQNTIDSETMVSFQKIVMKDKEVDGQKTEREIIFQEDTTMTKDKLKEKQFDMMKSEVDSIKEVTSENIRLNKSIYYVNKKLFKEAKYLVKVLPNYNSKTIEESRNVQFYDRAVMNPKSDKSKLLKQLRKQMIPNVDEDFVMEQQPAQAPVQNLGSGQEQQAKQPVQTFSSKFEI